VKRIVCAALALVFGPATCLHAQGSAINDLKGKIFDARMAKQTFANGLKFCNELDGTNFYFEPRNRVLKLEEYHRSLDNLVREHVYNPQKRRPWASEDAAERWLQVQQAAITDKANCELVASLPQLEKQLEQLEKSARDSKKN
jgi:hypothetical protein